jgi:hypothetical protein
VRDFGCPVCGQRLTFENSLCLSCGSGLGFVLEARAFAAIDDEVSAVDSSGLQRCANTTVAGCNWLARAGSDTGLCLSCELTRTRPADGDESASHSFMEAEAAKRRLVLELTELGLPIRGREVDPVMGLCFDLLSSAHEGVVTGHADGVITLDLAEGDDVHREWLRVSMDEPYRTLLGHLRHEIGHYYYMVLVRTDPIRAEFERLFGDPDADYQAAVDRHYAQGPPADWQETYVSAYATMHPAEDWAETFAHYLHIRDTLDTATAFGFSAADAAIVDRYPGTDGFDRLIELWLPLAWSLNMINRSMGHPDLYPFVLPPAALEKIGFVHRLVTQDQTLNLATQDKSLS